MLFPNMGGKQNIEGRFLGQLHKAIIRSIGGWSVVYSLIIESRGEICTSERGNSLIWLFSLDVFDKARRSEEETMVVVMYT